MARFLFVVPPLLGHLNPTLSVGGELLNRCHEVAWVSSKPFADDTIPEKGKFFLIDNIEDKIQAITQKVDAQKTFAFDFMYENVWLPYNRIIMEGLSEIVDQYKPSVLINDNYMFAATLCAYQKNISYATSVTALAEYICKHTMPELWNLREKYLFGFQKHCRF